MCLIPKLRLSHGAGGGGKGGYVACRLPFSPEVAPTAGPPKEMKAMSYYTYAKNSYVPKIDLLSISLVKSAEF